MLLKVSPLFISRCTMNFGYRKLYSCLRYSLNFIKWLVIGECCLANFLKLHQERGQLFMAILLLLCTQNKLVLDWLVSILMLEGVPNNGLDHHWGGFYWITTDDVIYLWPFEFVIFLAVLVTFAFKLWLLFQFELMFYLKIFIESLLNAVSWTK